MGRDVTGVDLMKTVYVIIRFRMEENIPIFKDAGIYGEPVLTSIDPLGEVQFMLFPSEGEDFRDAVHNAMLKVRMHPLAGDGCWFTSLRRDGRWGTSPGEGANR